MRLKEIIKIVKYIIFTMVKKVSSHGEYSNISAYSKSQEFGKTHTTQVKKARNFSKHWNKGTCLFGITGFLLKTVVPARYIEGDNCSALNSFGKAYWFLCFLLWVSKLLCTLEIIYLFGMNCWEPLRNGLPTLMLSVSFSLSLALTHVFSSSLSEEIV